MVLKTAHLPILKRILEEYLERKNITIDDFCDNLINEVWEQASNCGVKIGGKAISLITALDEYSHLKAKDDVISLEDTVGRTWYSAYEQLKRNRSNEQEVRLQEITKVKSLKEGTNANAEALNAEQSVCSGPIASTNVGNKVEKEVDTEKSGRNALMHRDQSLNEKKETKPVRSEISQGGRPAQKYSQRWILKNAQVGQEYSDELDFNYLGTKGKVTGCHINFRDPDSNNTLRELEEIGLQFIHDKRMIRGVPRKHGKPEENYDIHLEINYKTDIEEEASRREVFLKILPDPRSLWKNIAPDKKLGDWKDDSYNKIIRIEKKGFSTTNRKARCLITASKRGRSHAHKGLFRDDHVRITFLPDSGWSIIAVADGAGSAQLSRVGSKIACEISSKSIEESLKEKDSELSHQIHNWKKLRGMDSSDSPIKKVLYGILPMSAFKAAKAIEDEAKDRSRKSSDFHTTLLLAIHKEIEQLNFIAGFWIGDGALAVYDEKDEEIKLLGQPDGGAMSGETKFLTMKEIMTNNEELMNRTNYSIRNDFTALLAMTDGVSDPKFGPEKNLRDKSFWDKLWQELRNELFDPQNSENKGKELSDWLDFWSEGEHDDRSIAILY